MHESTSKIFMKKKKPTLDMGSCRKHGKHGMPSYMLPVATILAKGQIS